MTFLAAGGCAPAKGEDEDVVVSGRTVAAADVCAELATLVCESDQRCCTAEIVTPPTSQPDAGAPSDAPSDAPKDATAAKDATGDTASADVAVTDSAPAPSSCETEQLKRCRTTLGRLLDDPRLAYVPERGGKLLDSLKERSQKCWATPIVYADVSSLFVGSGPLSADCTPPSTSAKELRAASLSCSGGAACRLYLRSDGTNEGVCEARTPANMDSCSHAFDCGAGRFCKLPNDWKAGLWGRCQPMRGAGWQCQNDVECESGFCGDGVCGPRKEEQICLAVSYRKLVLADSPVAYLRLGDSTGTSASDSSTSGRPGELVGKVAGSTEGALKGDADRAIEITDPESYLKLKVGDALATAGAVSVEAWVAAGESGPVFELRGSIRTSMRVFRGGEKGDELRAAFVDAAGKMNETGPTKLAPGWHHIAITHDGTIGRLYVDGKEVAKVEKPLLVDPSDVLYVGHRPEIAPEPEKTLRGRYDEVAVYARALPPQGISRRIVAATEGAVTNTFPVFSFLE